MPFRIPTWVWTLNPLIRQMDASNNQPGSSKEVGNSQNQQDASDLADDPLFNLLGFPPGIPVSAPQDLVNAIRYRLLPLVRARRERRRFVDELLVLNHADTPADLNDLPVMTRAQFQRWWDNQDQLVFTTFLRNQEHHLLSALKLASELVEAEQNVQTLLEREDLMIDEIDDLTKQLKYEKLARGVERHVLKMEHEKELERERKKIRALKQQLSSMKSLKDDLQRCTDKLAEQDEVNSKGELLYPMLVVLDRLLTRKENEKPSPRQLNVQIPRGNKRDGDDSSGDIPPKSPRVDKKE